MGSFCHRLGLVIFIVCASFTGAQAQTTFGSSGWDGSDGSDGYSGRNGRDVSVHADGVAKSIVLNGTDGEDGDDGQNGDDASSCYHDYPANDVCGAEGGDGGDGGDGGNGGRGGDVTVYLNDLSELKLIGITALGGRGGRGGDAGWAGDGCQCSGETNWSHEHCYKDDDGNEQCDDYWYSCEDGPDGDRGSDGSDGYNGRDGRLYVVKGHNELSPNVMGGSVDMKDINGAQFDLAENIWSDHEGALALLADGSSLLNTYKVFEFREHHTFDVKWESPRLPQEFEGKTADISIKNRQVEMSLPYGLWADVETVRVGTESVATIKNVVTIDEARTLTFDVIGNKENTFLVLKQVNSHANLIKTQLHLKLWRVKFFKDSVEWDAEIPEELISLKDGNVMVNIGKLPVESPKTFKPGKKVKVQATITRSFAGNSTRVWMSKEKYKLAKEGK